MVIVDKDDIAPIDGMFYVDNSGQAEIKRVSFAGEIVSLISDNSRYPVKQVEIDNLRILGRVKFIFGGSRI